MVEQLQLNSEIGLTQVLAPLSFSPGSDKNLWMTYDELEETDSDEPIPYGCFVRAVPSVPSDEAQDELAISTCQQTLRII